ncbi:hypothetical protein GQX74_013250 [Glossina fuscipes]|nr:hypothetical protein GQX74_013250 [Glossina fuscipes]
MKQRKEADYRNAMTNPCLVIGKFIWPSSSSPILTSVAIRGVTMQFMHLDEFVYAIILAAWLPVAFYKSEKKCIKSLKWLTSAFLKIIYICVQLYLQPPYFMPFITLSGISLIAIRWDISNLNCCF